MVNIVTGTLIFIVDTVLAANVYMVWPHGNQYMAEEILRHSNLPSDNINNNFTFSGSHNDLSYTPLDLTGSYIDITINEPKTLDQFCFSIFLLPRTAANRTIFDYKTTASGDGIIEEIIVELSSSSMACVTMTAIISSVRQQTTHCNSFPSIAMNKWTGVSVSYILGDNKLNLNLPGKASVITISDSVNFLFPGILRLGGRFPAGSKNWDGLMACCLFYGEHVDSFDPGEIKHCQSAATVTSNVVQQTTEKASTTSLSVLGTSAIIGITAERMITTEPFSVITGSPTLHILSHFYIVVYNDSIIDTNVTSLSVSFEYNTRYCACQCSQLSGCESFTFSAKQCRLYSDVYHNRVVFEPDGRVFQRQTR